MSKFRNVVESQLIESLETIRGLPNGEEGGGIWMFCPKCRVRARPVWSVDRVTISCSRCKAESDESVDPAGMNQFPDIIAYEAAALDLFAAWIVGSEASYLAAIDRAFAKRRKIPPPPRASLTSVPKFRGVGEPPDGYGRSRLLRVFFEVDPATIREHLLAAWDADPRIVSRHVVD